MSHPRGLFVLDQDALDLIYGPAELRDIRDCIDLVAPPQTAASIADSPDLLKDVDFLFSGWGAPFMDEHFLKAAPRLKAVFYGAGAIGYCTTEAFWKRNITITTAASANAIPVAEYALGVILFSLKHGWALARQTRKHQTFPDRNGAPGCYKRTIGLISLGVTARMLLKLLRPFDLQVVAYDPFVAPEEAINLGVEIVSLEELFDRCDVVSLHTPLLPETVGMITGRHIDSMPAGSTFINTARGQIVREAEMIDVLARRPDLQAVLDVAEEEPPAKNSPLYVLPNVLLTPHIAGSVGEECRRMGRFMVDELHRYLAGQPLQWAVTPESVAHSSHRPCSTADQFSQRLRTA